MLAKFLSMQAIKAIAGGIGGGAVVWSYPLLNKFADGLLSGAGDKVHELGVVVGTVLVGGVINYAIVWLSPKNKEA